MTARPHILSKLSQLLLLVLTFLIPVFYLPLTLDPLNLPKYALLVVITAIMLLLWAIKQVRQREVTLVVTPFILPLFLFTMGTVVALFVGSANKVYPLLTPGSVGTLVTFFIFTFVVNQFGEVSHGLAKQLRLALAAGAIILSLVTSLVLLETLDFIVLPKFIRTYELLVVPDALTFLTVAIPLLLILGAPFIMRTLKKIGETEISLTPDSLMKSEALPGETNTEIFMLLLSSLFLLVGIGLAAYQLFTTTQPLPLLPYWAGWYIAIDGIKLIKTALFGVGPGNFLAAYTQIKPAFINSTPYWNVNFAISSNTFFQILTETGLVGLLLYISFAFRVLRVGLTQLFKSVNSVTPFVLGALGALAVQLFLPASIATWYFLFLGVALLGARHPQTRTIKESSIILAWLFLGFALLIIVPSVYFGSRAYAAEVLYKQTLVAISKNQADTALKKTDQIQKLNPYVYGYHVSASQLYLAIANNLASQKKEKIDEQTRTTISQLVQESIRQAKIAVSVGPAIATNWENLAGIYRSLINAVEGADNWTLQTYQQAVRLDPTNPVLRVNLGGVFFTLKRYDEAIQQFQISVALKSDFANGYYNLAAALREKGDFAQAANAMRAVLKIVPVNSEDYKKAEKELEEIVKKVPAVPETSAGQVLQQPTNSGPKITPPLKLDQTATPEIPEETTGAAKLASPTPASPEL